MTTLICASNKNEKTLQPLSFELLLSKEKNNLIIAEIKIVIKFF
jgi:hypothetical protein